MSTTNDGYLNFGVYNIFNVPSLSSYTLSNTPLIFKPIFKSFNTQHYSNEYMLWEFGDGSYSKEITATHTYTQPGTYNVTLKLINKNGEGLSDSVNRNVSIYNVVSDYVSLSTTGFTQLTAGVYSPPIDIYRFNSWQTHDNLNGLYSVIPFASGGQSIRYDVYKYSKQPYSQLIPTNRFVIREQVGVLDIFDDIIIDKIIIPGDRIYLTLNYNTKEYEISTVETENSVFAGTSGYQTIYFIDDLPTTGKSKYNLLFTLNTANFDTSSIFVDSLPVINVNTSVYTFDKIYASIPDKFVITSNGIAGEGQTLPTFAINNAQFQEGILSFVIRPKNLDNFTVNYISLSASPLDYTLKDISPENNTIFVSVLNKNDEVIPGYTTPLSSIQIYPKLYKDTISPYIKGKIILSNIPSLSSEKLKIYAQGRLTNIGIQYTDLSTYFYNLLISGVSDPFTVYNSNNYGEVAKINENFNSVNAYQSLATQPIIANSPILLNDILGQVGGNETSNVDTLGKRIYEKIANYVTNLSDIDTCNVEGLLSYTELYGIDTIKYVRENLITLYPSNLTRLVDLFSIKRNYLFGTRNNWIENLNKNTNVYDTVNGININLQTPTYSSQVITLPVSTTVLNKNDKYIVAYENFTQLYSIVPLEIKAVTTQTFPLSSIDNTWGWNLVLPDNFYTLSVNERVITLPKFYTFYKWNDYIDGTILGGVINWDDPNNTQIKLLNYEQYPQWNNPTLLSSWNDSPLSAWYEDNGYVDRNLIYTISNGVGILSGI